MFFMLQLTRIEVGMGKSQFATSPLSVSLPVNRSTAACHPEYIR